MCDTLCSAAAAQRRAFLVLPPSLSCAPALEMSTQSACVCEDNLARGLHWHADQGNRERDTLMTALTQLVRRTTWLAGPLGLQRPLSSSRSLRSTWTAVRNSMRAASSGAMGRARVTARARAASCRSSIKRSIAGPKTLVTATVRKSLPRLQWVQCPALLAPPKFPLQAPHAPSRATCLLPRACMTACASLHACREMPALRTRGTTRTRCGFATT